MAGANDRRALMRRSIVGMLAAATMLGGGAPAVSAASIRECGEYHSQHATNVTTRKVSCKTARRVIRTWNRTQRSRVRGFRCRYRDLAHELGDIRCTASRGRVVRWQTFA